MAIKTTLELIEETQEAYTQSLASLAQAGPGGDRIERNRADSLLKNLNVLKCRYNTEQNAPNGPATTIGFMRGH